jgi:hypothetical protein
LDVLLVDSEYVFRVFMISLRNLLSIDIGIFDNFAIDIQFDVRLENFDQILGGPFFDHGDLFVLECELIVASSEDFLDRFGFESLV